MNQCFKYNVSSTDEKISVRIEIEITYFQASPSSHSIGFVSSCRPFVKILSDHVVKEDYEVKTIEETIEKLTN